MICGRIQAGGAKANLQLLCVGIGRGTPMFGAQMT
jgi:hypothetical protein